VSSADSEPHVSSLALWWRGCWTPLLHIDRSSARLHSCPSRGNGLEFLWNVRTEASAVCDAESSSKYSYNRTNTNPLNKIEGFFRILFKMCLTWSTRRVWDRKLWCSALGSMTGESWGRCFWNSEAYSIRSVRYPSDIALQLMVLHSTLCCCTSRLPEPNEHILIGRKQSEQSISVCCASWAFTSLTWINPNEIAGSLKESVNGNILFDQIFNARPPRSVKIVDIVPVGYIYDKQI